MMQQVLGSTWLSLVWFASGFANICRIRFAMTFEAAWLVARFISLASQVLRILSAGCCIWSPSLLRRPGNQCQRDRVRHLGCNLAKWNSLTPHPLSRSLWHITRESISAEFQRRAASRFIAGRSSKAGLSCGRSPSRFFFQPNDSR